MPETTYPDLQRIRKELNLLQKLYGLYNTVNDTIDGYYDIPWVDVDIEKINNDLIDFQNRQVFFCALVSVGKKHTWWALLHSVASL